MDAFSAHDTQRQKWRRVRHVVYKLLEAGSPDPAAQTCDA